MSLERINEIISKSILLQYLRVLTPRITCLNVLFRKRDFLPPMGGLFLKLLAPLKNCRGGHGG